MTKAECKAEKDKLGIKECFYDRDYWAGAVKQCGGVSKMPTQADLTELAKVLYKEKFSSTPSINSSGSTGGYIDLNTSKASSMGFPRSSFSVWSGVELGDDHAYYRSFQHSLTQWSVNWRDDRFNQAVCLGD